MASTTIFKKPNNADSQHCSVVNPVKVFCRLRPLNSQTQKCGAYIRNFSTVVLTSQGIAMPQKLNFKQETHFAFKQVFDTCATQSDVFNTVAYPLVERLVRGQNSLLFTYGVTGSGKTYTMTGDSAQCGIMPRCLGTLFRSIASRHAAKCTFQSDHLNGFEIATAAEVEVMERHLLEKAQRTPLSTPRAQLQSLRRKNSEQEFKFKNLGSPIVALGVRAQHIYAVFISYIEIYNNSVYDLLEEGPVQKVLESHIVREDAHQNMYVHGATELEIKSVHEAMEAFQLGQKRKRMGQTMLNTESSRGHAVFNIRLVQAAISGSSAVTVSQLSLVDLAGSERSARTKNAGARLREAGNINNSLMTLRTCLQYLRENQQAPMGTLPKQIPYRDSKITQLFKNFFQGEGQVSMIVCINPRLEDYLENAQVLKFAELTQEVQICTAKPANGNLGSTRKMVHKEKSVLKERNNTNSELKTQPQNYFDLERRLDLYRKRILELEAQNTELRKEVETLRRNCKTFIPGPHKTLMARQKSMMIGDRKASELGLENLRKEKAQAMLTHGLRNGERVYENELKIKLTERRQILEEYNETEHEIKKRRFSKCTKHKDSIGAAPTANGEHDIKIKEEVVQEPKKLKLSLCRQESHSMQGPHCLRYVNNICCANTTPSALIETQPQTNNRHSLSAAPILQQTLQSPYDSFGKQTINAENSKAFPPMFTTPKMPFIQHSTPLTVDCNWPRKALNFETPQSTRSLKFSLFEKDDSFDRREQELTLKIATHRKKLTENKKVVKLLQTFKRAKSSTCFYGDHDRGRDGEHGRRRRSHSNGEETE